MKISKLFHWLYACIMFLPLLVIPIFAINIINRSPTPISIQYQIDDVKNFYQGVKNGKPNENLDNIIIDDISSFPYQFDDGYLRIDVGSNALDLTFQCEEINLNLNDIIYFSVNLYNITQDNFVEIYIDNEDVFYQNFILPTTPSLFSYYLINTTQDNFIERINFYTESDDEFLIKDVQLFNLTTIFGSGNEPTKEVFESYLTQDYYNFGDNDVVVGKTYITYDDTDIGSQYVYSLYHVVDKYFNFNNILPFEGVYNWFLAYVFAGVSPVGFTLLYNLMMYWLFVSLVWLMFDVFMYVPLVIHNLIDKARLE